MPSHRVSRLSHCIFCRTVGSEKGTHQERLVDRFSRLHVGGCVHAGLSIGTTRTRRCTQIKTSETLNKNLNEKHDDTTLYQRNKISDCRTFFPSSKDSLRLVPDFFFFFYIVFLILFACAVYTFHD